MGKIRVLALAELPRGGKKTVQVGETEILLLEQQGSVVAVQAKCPHAGAPLEKGAVCNGRLVCPWHMATFALPSGELLEPPAMVALKTYAVDIEGAEIYVDPEPLAPERRPASGSAELRTILLVGAGAAGTMAAVTLRQEGFAGRIVAVDPVNAEPVDRTQLSKQALAGKMPLPEVGLNALAGLDVERVQASVEAVSASEGVARLSNGASVRFDRALIATGGTPKRLAIPGAERAHTIRHVEDVRRILAAGEGKQRAAIIGTSFIGLEAASALTQKGLKVTVVGREALPFAKKFGAPVAEALKAFHQSKGTGFRLGVEILGITEQGVEVSAAGERGLVPADLVILGVGVEPALGFAHDLPLAAEGGGVRTDASLRVHDKVWVAGDIASVDGVRIEHWRLAEQHGRVAAMGMLGADGGAATARYQGVPFFWSFHYGKRLGYLGHATEWDEIVTDGDVAGLEFMAFYTKAGDVKAVLSCGRDTQMAMLAERMRAGLTVDAARRALAGA